MNKKENKIDLRPCKTCMVGSCCYEGVELTKREMNRILKFGPNVRKPWFRIVRGYEEPDKKYPFSTIIRGGTCIFQDKNNRCVVYSIRPKNCRNFPLEDGIAAPYFKRLCSRFYKIWPYNSVRKTYSKRQKK